MSWTLLEVKGVSESSSKSDDCGLVHVEDVGLLVELGELGVDAGCDGVLGVEGTFGVADVCCVISGPLMAVKYDSISSFDCTNDVSGLVMRLFGTELFVVDGLVMKVFVPKLFAGNGPVMKVFALAGRGLERWLQTGFG